MVSWLGLMLLAMGVSFVVMAEPIGRTRAQSFVTSQNLPEGVEPTDVKPSDTDILMTRIVGGTTAIIGIGLLLAS